MGRFMIANSAAKTPWNTGYTDKKKGTQKVFDCLFCEAADSVDVKLNKKEKIGSLRCRKCLNQFQCAIIYLDSEVDVYANWIDACEAVAKKEVDNIKEKADEKKGVSERKEETGVETLKPVAKKRGSIVTEPTKPMIKKRKLEKEAPKPVKKRSKIKNIPTMKKPTDLTKTASTKPDSAMPLHTFSAKNDAQSKMDLGLAIERNRKGREAEAAAELQRKTALAKERRVKKTKQQAKLEEEEIRKGEEVTTAAVAAAAIMTAKRSHDHPLVHSSDKSTAKANPENEDPATADNATTEDTTQIYAALFGNSSDDRSATNIFDVPTPMGSPKSSPNHPEQQMESVLMVEESVIELSDTVIEVSETTGTVREASRDSALGNSISDQETRRVGENRRDSLNSLFGSSG